MDRLPGLTVRVWRRGCARAVLAAGVRAPLDERVRDRILAEARGNPLALVELPRSAGRWPGWRADSRRRTPVPVPSRIEQSFRPALELLAPAARLLVTSPPPTRSATRPAVAGRRTPGPGRGCRAGVRPAGRVLRLVEFGTGIRFCHPLARSAAYRAAGAGERRQGASSPGPAIDPVADPDRRAWHRAQASAGPDEEVAAELEDSRGPRQGGGVAAEAAFLERSAALTLDRTVVSSASLAAAGPSSTSATSTRRRNCSPPSRPRRSECRSARPTLLRGRLSFVRSRGGDGALTSCCGPPRLADADPPGSRAYYLDALEMGLDHRRPRPRGGGRRGPAPRPPAPPSSADRSWTAWSGSSPGRRAAGAILRPIVSAPDDEVWARRPSLGFLLAVELWDFGALSASPPHGRGRAASPAPSTRCRSGWPCRPPRGARGRLRCRDGADLGGGGDRRGHRRRTAVYPRLHLAALRGRRPEASNCSTSWGAGPDEPQRAWATAVLHNGLADYPAALEAAAGRRPRRPRHGGLALPELIEAAVRCGETDLAAVGARVPHRANAGGRRRGVWASGLRAGPGHRRRERLPEAIGTARRLRAVVYRARAHLLYGEWLRRQGRRRDARSALRQAHESLSDLGMEAFAERAVGELRATGEQARGRTSKASDRLTMQEVHIARLVADGATSKEVAAKLFLSPRTVDAHLRNIFRKLGLTSRRQLRDLPDIR
jgi:DNA-binding CsgD family transcriptional regulator